VAVVLVVQRVSTVEAKEPTAYFQLPLQQAVAVEQPLAVVVHLH
jgi:hypothetical protein